MKEIKSDIIDISLLEGEMIFAIYKVREITPPIAEEVVRARIEAFEGKNYPLLVDGRMIKTITKEARDILSSEDAMVNVTVCALVADSMVGTIIGNFFLRINKPALPIKLFTNMEEAKAWLRKRHRGKKTLKPKI